MESTIRALAGYTVRADKVTGSKLERAQPLAAQAEVGNVKLVRGAWNEPFLQELHAFPTKGVPDDQVDAASGAFNALKRREELFIGSVTIGGHGAGLSRRGLAA